MIVEFFGPPGSGKTTFSLRLADRLRDGGHPVSLKLSALPGEKSPQPTQPARKEPPARTSAPLGPAARRLMAPAYELIVNVAQRPADAGEAGVANALAHAMPRGQIFRSLRMRQYLVRLSNAWAQAARNRGIWIFDQAYIQAVASIVLVQPPMSDEAIAALLEVAPHSDLAIRVEAPEPVIESRLGQRRRQIGGGGRLFEEDGGDTVQQSALAEQIDRLLRQRDRPVLSLRSAGDELPDNCLDLAEQTIIALLNEACARIS